MTSPRSAVASFNLPLALFEAPAEAELDLIERMRSRLRGLALQRCVIELAAFFEREPALRLALFIFRDHSPEGGRDWRESSLATNLGHASTSGGGRYELDEAIARICPSAEPTPDQRRLLGQMLNWACEADAEAMDQLHGLELRRPSERDPLPGLMSQALPPEDFALWQSAYLAARLPADSPRAPRAPRAAL